MSQNVADSGFNPDVTDRCEVKWFHGLLPLDGTILYPLGRGYNIVQHKGSFFFGLKVLVSKSSFAILCSRAPGE